MKGTSIAMRMELAAGSRIARCYKITPEHGDPITVTDHDRDIVDPTDGLTYTPLAGGSQSDVTGDTSLAAGTVEVRGAATTPYPTLETIVAKDWDNARILLFYICWADPSKGRHIQRAGTLGECSTMMSEFSAEFRSLLGTLVQTVGEVAQLSCRWTFGEGVPGEWGCNADGTTDPEDFMVEATVDAVEQGGIRIEASELAEVPNAGSSGTYAFGYILIIDDPDSPKNNDRRADVKFSEDGAVLLHEPLPYPLSVGTTFKAYQGCNGLREVCRDRFSNIHNHNGEAWAPGPDKVMAVARSN